MITVNNILTRNGNGREVISIEKVKNALCNTKQICSDGHSLYLQIEDGFLWKKLDNDANLSLRMYLFNKEAQAKISKGLMDQVIKDLIVDTNILVDIKNINPFNYVNFRNGIYSLNEKKLYDKGDKAVANMMFSYMINVDFVTAESSLKQMPVFTKFIQSTFKCDVKSDYFVYILQNLGFLMTSINYLRKVVVLIGAPASGKSTLANFLSSVIFPESVVSHVNFQDLGEKFRLYDVACAKINIGDEMNRTKIKNLSNFKSLTSGEPVVIERKGCDPFWIRPNVRQLYCTNYLPSFDDGNAMAIFDRLNIIPFYETVNDANRDYGLLEKLQKERDSIVSRAVEEFADVLKNNGCFTVPNKVKEYKKRCIMSERSVEEFIENYIVEDRTFKGVSSVEVYNLYQNFCKLNGFKIKNQTDLREGILAKYANVEYKRKRLAPATNVWSLCGITIKESC